MRQAGGSDPLGLVGRLLDGRYRIDAWIAEGGFGMVYAGQHIGLTRRVAIKVLKRPPEVGASTWGVMIGQFLEEARLVTRLRHPAIVAVLDAGVTAIAEHAEGLPWIVMEWLDGETLADDLARRRGLRPGGRTRAETFALLRPIIEAVAEAHRAGIVHRDLKPHNIMLTPGRDATSARILDFGIAKIMSPDATPASAPTTNEAARAFSIEFAAPEQLSGGRTGPWTDVHALGLLMTEVLCGGRARPSDDIDAHYRAAFDPTRPTPASLGVDAGDWEPVLARALALSSSARYASASELLAALDASPDARPIPSARGRVHEGATTSSAPSLRRKTTWPRRAVVPAALTAAAVAVASTAPVLRCESSECTSDAACSRDGAPGICRPGAGCVALRSQDCEPFADRRALASSSTVWFGAMFPRTGPDARAFGNANVNAVELARRDFTQIMSGVSATGANERARPFGLIVCDDAADSTRAARHLVELGVPAVIGFYTSVEAIDLTTSLFLPNRTLAIAALNANPLVTRVPHPDGVPRLVWRTTYSSAAAATALSAWIAAELEPGLRRRGELAAGRAMRVALLYPRGAAGAALRDTFFTALRFNGKTALDNGASYRQLAFEAEAPRTSPEYAEMARELLGFAPHVILHAGNVAIVEALFAALEHDWPHDAPYRPRYAGVAPLPRELLELIGTNADRRRRFFGVTPPSSNIPNARFVTHYKETFRDETTLTNNPNTAYDAFYLLAYATYAIPRGERVTGERLSRAFGKLAQPGRRIEVGLTEIYDAYVVLSKDGAIELEGATGKLDLGPATGEPAFDLAILCVGVDDHGSASDGVESGLVYSATSKRLEGKMHCP